jgi:transposase
MLNGASRGRFGIAKAQEVKYVASKSFGVKIATDAVAFQVRQLIDQILFAEDQLAVLDKNIAEYYDKFICTIDSIPGVGKVTAAIILSEIGDINRFSEPAKLVAFAGIDPTVKQSGDFQGTKNKMSKRGSSYLRRAAWISANVASFHDPVLSAFYKKKRSEGKPHLVAVGAVARKLLYIVFALLKSGKLYDPTYAIS